MNALKLYFVKWTWPSQNHKSASVVIQFDFLLSFSLVKNNKKTGFNILTYHSVTKIGFTVTKWGHMKPMTSGWLELWKPAGLGSKPGAPSTYISNNIRSCRVEDLNDTPPWFCSWSFATEWWQIKLLWLRVRIVDEAKRQQWQGLGPESGISVKLEEMQNMRCWDF